MSELKTKVRQNMYAKRGVFDDSSKAEFMNSIFSTWEVLKIIKKFCSSTIVFAVTLPGLLCNESHKNCIKGLKLAVQVAFCHAIQPH